MDSKKPEFSSDTIVALITATLAAFMTPFMGSSINIALPSIGKEFGADAVMLGWIATAFLLTAAMSLVPLGRVADIKGRKLVFLSGDIIFTAGSLFSALSISAEMLILSRAVQGIGAAMIFGTGVAILTSVFPPGQRGKVLGINVAAVYTGLSLGPFLGGFLTQHLGWRSIFFFNIPIGILIAILVVWKLKEEWAEAKGESFDFTGSAIYCAMLVLITLGVSSPHPALIGSGILLLIIFVLWEARIEHPVLEIRLFRYNVTFAFSNLAALLNYSATFALTFLLSLYLQYIRGLTPQNAGLILIFQPFVMALLSPLAGWLSDKIEPKVVASAGMAVLTAGLFIFSSIEADTPEMLIIGNLIFLGFGYALFSSPNTNAIMGSVERKFLGVASATLSTMRTVGQMLSMAMVMLILSIYVGRAEIIPELYPSLLKSIKTSFLIFSALCFTGIFASLARGKLLEIKI
jgi:EmrB/QacA subfamily drug resistance transporter